MGSAVKWVSHLDWLTLTIKGGSEPEPDGINRITSRDVAVAAFEMFGLEPESVGEVHRGDFGYAFGFTHVRTNTVCHIGHSLSGQGVKLVFSGTSLRAIGDDLSVLRTALASGWKPTRIDVAYDILNSGESIADFASAYLFFWEGQHKRRCQLIKGRTGDTFTIGARSSMKYVRVYDKAAEQDTPGDWKRVEIELKAEAAVEYAQDIVDNINCSAALIQHMFGGFASPLASIIAEAATGVEINHTVGRLDGASNTLRWLKNSVIPAIVKLGGRSEPEYREFLQELWEAQGEAGLLE